MLLDGAAERPRRLAEETGFELGGEDGQLAASRLADLAAGAREPIPGPREGEEVGAASATVSGEHRAHATMAVGVGADDDPIVAPDPLEHGLPGSHRQAVDRAPQVLDGPAGGVAISSHKL